MRIWTENENGSLELSAMRCERCKQSTSMHDPEGGLSKMREFIQITIDAGPDARYFEPGESLVADLCEGCAHELLSPCLRRVRTASGEIEFPFLDLSEMGIDLPDEEPPPEASRH